jgi:hypothetical protein
MARAPDLRPGNKPRPLVDIEPTIARKEATVAIQDAVRKKIYDILREYPSAGKDPKMGSLITKEGR